MHGVPKRPGAEDAQRGPTTSSIWLLTEADQLSTVWKLEGGRNTTPEMRLSTLKMAPHVWQQSPSPSWNVTGCRFQREYIDESLNVPTLEA